MKELILGGVRSGKSRLAEQRAQQSGLAVVYIATATADDEEMRSRIRAHRSRRPAAWITVEEPLTVAQAVREYACADRCLLFECLTLWLTNWLCASHGSQQFERERAAFIAAARDASGHLIFVGNETGLGIVPIDPLSRRFSEQAGLLHQDFARVCDRVTLVAAGLPLQLKGGPA